MDLHLPETLRFILTSCFDAIESPGCTLIMALSAIRLQFRSQVSCSRSPGLLFLAAISFESFRIAPMNLGGTFGAIVNKNYYFTRARCISVFLSDTKRVLQILFSLEKSRGFNTIVIVVYRWYSRFTANQNKPVSA